MSKILKKINRKIVNHFSENSEQSQIESLIAGILLTTENSSNNVPHQSSNNETQLNSEKSSHHPILGKSPINQASALKSATIVEKKFTEKKTEIIPFSPESKMEWLP